MSPLFKQAIGTNRSSTLMDELLIAWTLGTPDKNYPDCAIEISVSSLPQSWYELNNGGVIRLQELGTSERGQIYRVWKPYPFLLKYWMQSFTIFHFDDLAGLQAEIFAGTETDPNKRKGFCFQRAGIFF